MTYLLVPGRLIMIYKDKVSSASIFFSRTRSMVFIIPSFPIPILILLSLLRSLPLLLFSTLLSAFLAFTLSSVGICERLWFTFLPISIPGSILSLPTLFILVIFKFSRLFISLIIFIFPSFVFLSLRRWANFLIVSLGYLFRLPFDATAFLMWRKIILLLGWRFLFFQLVFLQCYILFALVGFLLGRELVCALIELVDLLGCY